MEVPEAGVRLVEGMYKGMNGRVLIGPGMSEEVSKQVKINKGI